jgi:serine/threonine protein kinase
MGRGVTGNRLRRTMESVEKRRLERESNMATRSVFQSSALVSGLVTAEQLDQIEAALRAEKGGAAAIDDEFRAARMVDMAILTNYQAEQLKAGRTKLNLGPYIITDWIGQGGMGQVFKAVHKMMGRECAVKVLPMHKATPESIANFAREIRTQAQLDHPHLVRAFDAGHDGKVHYLVTEYVPGTDLRRLVRSRGALSVQQSANVILQAALGLAYAHSRGLIHRDVKPGNILVTPEGVAKVSDLGLAGYINEGDQDPRAGKIVGTADYLSPEQIQTPREVTKASDIYSLGCTLYYAVCGKVPYPGGSTRDKARRHCEETPWHPRRFNPDLSEEFVEIIADMMEKDPKERIQSAEEVASRLEPWAQDASPLIAQQLSKSRWLAPPPPEDDDNEGAPPEPPPIANRLRDVAEPASGEVVDHDVGQVESPSELSQGSQAVDSEEAPPALFGQKHARERKPLLNFSDSTLNADSEEREDRGNVDDEAPEEEWSVGLAVAVALSIAVPTSMLFGAALTFVLLRLLG